jgi:hypothetical protein
MNSSTDAGRKSVSPLATYVIYGLTAAALLLGIALVAASWISFAQIQQMLQRQYGGVLTARRLTREFYEQKQHLVRIVGILSLLAGGILFGCRGLLARALSADLYYLQRGWRRLSVSVRYALRHTQRSEILDLLVVTAVGLADRLIFLRQPARFDEAVSYLDYASKPLYLLLSVYTEPENHIFNTLMVHISTGIFGGHLWAIRLPAFCAGVLMVPLAYLACRQLYGRLPAVVSASLVATSSILLEYSTNGRGYTVVGCCFLTLLLCGTLLLRKTNPVLLVVVAAATAIGFYAIPIMLFPSGAILVWIAISVLRRRGVYLRSFWKLAAGAVVLAGLLTVIFYSPVFVVSGVKAVTANPYVKKIDFASFIVKNEGYMHDTWRLWNQDYPIWGVVLGVLGVVLSVALPTKKLNPQRRLIGAIFVWCVFALIFFRFAPFPRVWLFLVPIYLISAATGLVYLGEKIEPGWAGWNWVWRGVGFVLLVALSASDISRRVHLDSQETGGCRNAQQVTDYLLQNGIPLQRLIRPAVCNMQMIYYYLPKSGKPLQEIRFMPSLDEAASNEVATVPVAAGPRTYWVYTNADHGDTLAGILHRDNLDGITVLSKIDYDGGSLSQIRVDH